MWKSKFYGAFVASTSTPSTRRLLDGVAMPVPHPTHWLISTQVASSIFRNNIAEEATDSEGKDISNSGKGSAVTVTDGVLDVRDSIFDGNTQYKQGTLYTWETHNISVTNCTFVGNEATDGRAGAVCFEVDKSNMDRSSLQVWDSTFKGNKCQAEGGALYTLRIKKVNISNCLFEENESTGGPGGGAYVLRPQEDDNKNVPTASRLHVLGSVFRANTNVDSCDTTCKDGGGLYVLQVSNVTIDKCTFEENRAGAKGGGLYVQPYVAHTNSDVRVLRTSIRNNEAATNGGGAFVGSSGATTFADVDFLDNSAGLCGNQPVRRVPSVEW